jgi:hypothetical protein
MNGPRSTSPEYTGKHRRDSGPGVLPPAWGRRSESSGRSESYARTVADSRPAPDGRPGPAAAALPSRRTDSGFRPEAGKWLDAG